MPHSAANPDPAAITRRAGTASQFSSNAEYQKYRRIITGQTRFVQVPIDSLMQAYDESPELRRLLDDPTVRAMSYLRSTNGVYARDGRVYPDPIPNTQEEGHPQ